MRRLVSVGLGLLLLTGCGQDQITPPSLERALSTQVLRLYDRQQQLIGAGSVVLPRVLSRCRRSGGAAAGAGDDWICELSWTPPGAAQTTARFDLSVTAGGCWRAEGPAAAVGPAVLLDVAGHQAINPLAAFDGCLEAFPRTWAA